MQPHITLVGAEKGGTGKTTISTNLAVMRALAGFEVLLVDTDETPSAARWAQVRAQEGHEPKIFSVQMRGRLGLELIKLKEKFNCIIVDAGGRDSMELRQVMGVADATIVPVRPGQFDAWSMSTQAQMVRDVEARIGEKLNVRVLLNCVHSNPAIKNAQEVRDLLEHDYADVLPVMTPMIRQRVVFENCVASGRTVPEIGSDAKAIEELVAVYAEIFQ